MRSTNPSIHAGNLHFLGMLATNPRLNATYHMDGPQWWLQPKAEVIAGQDF
jgi:hypothetical protein